MKTSKKQALGFHKNQKRIWINDGTIGDADLQAGDTILHSYYSDKGELVIEKSNSGKHKIAETHKGGVIDIVNKQFTNCFKDYEYVDVIAESGKIIVRGNHAESQIKEREEAILRRVKTGEPLRKGGAFVGLGLLDRSIHRGLKNAGVPVKQRFANEYNSTPAEVNLSGNEIWDDAYDDAVFCIDDIFTMKMDIIPKLDVLVMGSPCPAFSQLNTTHEKAGTKDIWHKETGTVFQPILEVVRRSNTAVFILENSKYFEGSVFDYIMDDVMSRMGYKSTTTVVTGQAFGDFEKRERLCKVWYSKGLPELSLDNLPFQTENKRAFSSMLEPIGDDDKRWGRRKYLEAKDEQTHNFHEYKITSPDATKLPTCGANYFRIQPDSPMVLHPSKSMFTRIMTPSEHCNVRDIGGELKRNIVAIENGEHYCQKHNRSNAKEAHKMLGNSCSPKPWESIGYRIGEWLLNSLETKNTNKKTITCANDEYSSFENQFAFAF